MPCERPTTPSEYLREAKRLCPRCGREMWFFEERCYCGASNYALKGVRYE